MSLPTATVAVKVWESPVSGMQAMLTGSAVVGDKPDGYYPALS